MTIKQTTLMSLYTIFVLSLVGACASGWTLVPKFFTKDTATTITPKTDTKVSQGAGSKSRVTTVNFINGGFIPLSATALSLVGLWQVRRLNLYRRALAAVTDGVEAAERVSPNDTKSMIWRRSLTPRGKTNSVANIIHKEAQRASARVSPGFIKIINQKGDICDAHATETSRRYVLGEFVGRMRP